MLEPTGLMIPADMPLANKQSSKHHYPSFHLWSNRPSTHPLLWLNTPTFGCMYNDPPHPQSSMKVYLTDPKTIVELNLQTSKKPCATNKYHGRTASINLNATNLMSFFATINKQHYRRLGDTPLPFHDPCCWIRPSIDWSIDRCCLAGARKPSKSGAPAASHHTCVSYG